MIESLTSGERFSFSLLALLVVLLVTVLTAGWLHAWWLNTLYHSVSV